MTAHQRVLAENIITLEWKISELTRAIRASVCRGVEQDIQSHIISKYQAIYRTKMDKLRKDYHAVRRQSFDLNLGFGNQFEVPYKFDPMPAETEADHLIQTLYSQEPEIKKYAHNDPSVTFKHVEDILADQ